MTSTVRAGGHRHECVRTRRKGALVARRKVRSAEAPTMLGPHDSGCYLRSGAAPTEDQEVQEERALRRDLPDPSARGALPGSGW